MRQKGKQIGMTKDEKIRLILRQLNKEATLEERSQFSMWLLESSENLDLYIEIKELWESPMTRQLEFNSAKADKKIDQIIQQKERSIRFWQHSRRIAAVVIILIIAGTAAYHQLNQKTEIVSEVKPVQQIIKKSEAGEQLRVTLPDGSVVHLNAGSFIRFPEKFDSDLRKVTLVGEAFFEVVKNPQQPFVVESENIMTEVLGTSFNIKAFKNENIAITVATGKVLVKHIQEKQPEELILSSNEQAVYKKNEKHFERAAVDASHFYAWTTGIIRFNNESLEQVVHALERWYNVSIQLEENYNTHIRVNGSYKDKRLYTILNGLSFMYDLEYQYKNGKTIIISNK